MCCLASGPAEAAGDADAVDKEDKHQGLLDAHVEFVKVNLEVDFGVGGGEAAVFRGVCAVV